MIRDIVTRVHVVTVRIRDGVTRYALCTNTHTHTYTHNVTGSNVTGDGSKRHQVAATAAADVSAITPTRMHIRAISRIL